MKHNKYWFRKRRGLFSPDLGWGWVPITREGWLVVLAYVIFVTINSFLIVFLIKDDLKIGINMIAMIFFSIIVIMMICHKKTDNSKKVIR
jgi:hypothetical protein